MKFNKKLLFMFIILCFTNLKFLYVLFLYILNL